MIESSEPTGEVQKLAAYFRQHPGALDEAPDSIARATGASIEVVRSLLQEPDHPGPSSGRHGGAAFQSALRDVVHGFDRLLRYPLLFIGVTTGFFLLAMWLIPGQASMAGRTGLQFTIREASMVGAFGMTLLLHLACYFRVGMVRYALMGGGLVAGVSYVLLTIQLLQQPRASSMSIWAILALLALGMILLGAFYAALGVGAALLGAYRRLRREERARRRRTRQELLQRLFEVEETLTRSEAEAPSQPRLTDLFQGVVRNIWAYATVAGFAWSLVLVIVSYFFPEMLAQSEGRRAPLWAPFVAIAISAGSMGTQIFLAYLTGRPFRAIATSVLFVAAGTLAYLLPVGEFGWRWLVQNQANLYMGVGLAVVTGLFAGLGAMVEERAYLARRRGQNAPEVLLAEMIELRRALNRGEQHRCVMVVDTARSSVMKSKSDPLVAEWSFRAYQEFLAEQVRNHNGRIHSTAGDGAVAAFDDAEEAFECARSIQTKIADFNANVNRLRDPFRLRIGIHCGLVSGELEEVQFAAVIDIAAHIEAASQVGGIAVTGTIAEQLPDHRFAELNETIDDQRVLLALNPTLDPEDEG
ncbi:MAG: adenylate/guanylate cyclase domain-containing protein [Methanoregulaceae archaeon]|nr:adenylate/guanylate cyclase domain-containing protein [Methanoregulaceae archaeon]